MNSVPIGIVGCGKIARDQHLPAIAGCDAITLTATADPVARLDGVPGYTGIDAMLAAHPEIAAVSLCQPPAFRAQDARAAIAAGRHVLLEKPPGTDVAEVQALELLAAARGVTLFTAWHSQMAPGVAVAQTLLAGRRIERIEIHWLEDARVWHPGQRWLWEAGGFGVFDPGINALSILTLLVSEPIEVETAQLSVPANFVEPIAAELRLRAGSIPVAATFDARHPGPQRWDLVVHTDCGPVALSHGGGALSVEGTRQALPDEGEYPALYRRFAECIAEGRSMVDVRPLALATEARETGERRTVEPYIV